MSGRVKSAIETVNGLAEANNMALTDVWPKTGRDKSKD
jgi:hypothetical protein